MQYSKKQNYSNRLSRQCGFSMIEVIVILIVLAAVLAIMGPDLTRIRQTQAIRSTSTKLISAINFTRQEAISQNRTVTICPRNDTENNTCNPTAGADWSFGWIVFVDTDDNGVMNGTETPLRLEVLQNNTGTTISKNNDPALAYASDGRDVSGVASSTFEVRNKNNADITGRNIILNAIGNPRVAKAN